MKIIGIDPGFDRNGIAVIDRNGSKDALLFSMLVQTDKKQEMSERLAVVAVEIERILFEYKPDLLIMEQLFMSKNVTTVIGVAGARGVILASTGTFGIPTREMGPMQVKLGITGYGKAEKSAVAMMVGKLITLPDRKMVDDEMDAIAIALAGSAVFGHQYASRK